MTWNRVAAKTAAKAEMKQSFWIPLCILWIQTIGLQQVMALLIDQPLASWIQDLYYRFERIEAVEDFSEMLPLFSELMNILLIVVVFSIVFHLFVTNPLKVGMYTYFLNAPYGDRTFSQFFVCFRSAERYWGAVKTMALYDIYLFLWMLLPYGVMALMVFGMVVSAAAESVGGMLTAVLLGMILLIASCIPYIIKRLSYYMVPYIAADHYQLGPTQVISLSKELTRGEKGNLFVLDLSFIGWRFVASFAAGFVSWVPVIGVFASVATDSVVDMYLYHTAAQVYFTFRYRRAAQDAPAAGGGYSQPSYNGYQMPGAPLAPQQNYWQQPGQPVPPYPQQQSQWQPYGQAPPPPSPQQPPPGQWQPYYQPGQWQAPPPLDHSGRTQTDQDPWLQPDSAPNREDDE